MRYDFGAYNSDGRLTVVVEAKRSIGTSADWASQFRRNILAHGKPLPGDLFVLVAPDKIYAWSTGAALDSLPDLEIDARPVLGPYFERAHTRPEQIDPQAFELLVAWWLEDLAREPTSVGDSANGAALAKAFSGARIARAVAA